MKRQLAAILSLLLLCTVLTACEKPSDQEILPLEKEKAQLTTEIPENPEPAPQQEVDKVRWDELPNKESFDARVRVHWAGGAYSESLGFLLYDLNGDGADDLLIGRDGYILDAYTASEQLVDGTVDANCYAYLCEGNVLAKVLPFSGSVGFYQIENGELTWIKTIRHESGEEERWAVDDSENPLQWRVGGREITQEEYLSIWDSYSRIPMEFMPLSQYPLDEDLTHPEYPSTADGYDSYDQIVQSRAAERMHKPFTYALIDLDGDGQEEFYLDRIIQQDIYTMADGKTKMLWATWDDVLCQGGIIRERRVYSGDNVVYVFHKITGETLTRVEYLRYDAERNPENPWLRSTDATGQDVTMVPISQAEFQTCLESYQPMELDLKPLADYPME